MSRSNMSEVHVANTRDIGYLDGRLSSLEKTMDETKKEFREHRAESKKELEEIKDKLDKVVETMSLWKYILWIFKSTTIAAAALLGWKGLDKLLKLFTF